MNTYNELVMPKNYAVVNEEEMTYVDGGASVSSKWWGYYVYLSHEETQTFIKASDAASSYIPGVAFWLKAIMYLERKLIGSKDKGNGVRIRMTGRGTGAFITGVSSR
jgi:hypothetical protein